MIQRNLSKARYSFGNRSVFANFESIVRFDKATGLESLIGPSAGIEFEIVVTRSAIVVSPSVDCDRGPRNFGMIDRAKLSLFIGESYFTAQ